MAKVTAEFLVFVDYTVDSLDNVDEMAKIEESIIKELESVNSVKMAEFYNYWDTED